MKTASKRIAAFSLAFIMTLMCAINYVVINADAADVLFRDDFETVMSNQWSDLGYGNIDEGKLILKADKAMFVEDENILKQQYVVAADVSVNYQDPNERSGFVSIVAHTDKNNQTGYEFGIGLSKNGSAYLRLYRRGEGNAEIIYQSNKVEGLGAISKKKSYTLKLSASDGKIYCLVNDCVFTIVEDTAYKSGYAGISARGIKGIFENFSVEKLPQKKVEKFEVLSASQKVALTEKIYFEAKIKYNSIYGSETINQDTAGVSIHGYDGNVGNKRITISYNGATASFPLEIYKDYRPTVLYQDSFDSVLENYDGGKSTYEDGKIEYSFRVNNGKMHAAYPNMKGYNTPVKTTLTLKDEFVSEWKTYAVSTDLTITSDATTATERMGTGALIFAKSKASDEYNFRLASNGKISIYEGSALLASVQASEHGINVQKGKTVNLKAEVFESYAIFYCNNKKVYTYYFAGDILPGAGISAFNGGMSFDNFKVVSVLNRGSHAAKSISLVLSDGSQVTTLYAKSIEDANVYLKVSYIDGAVDHRRVKNSMLSGYDPDLKSSTPQQITVTYGSLTTRFTYVYRPYLFSDSFEGTSINNQWSCDSSDNMTVSTEKGKLKFAFNPKGAGSSTSIKTYISGGESWDNYSVSAEIFMDPRSSSQGRTRYSALIARKNGNTWYEYRIAYSSDGYLTGNLYRFDKDGANSLSIFTSGMLADCLKDGKTAGTGETYKLRMTVYNNIIQCYFEDELLTYYVDDGDKAILSGTAGIRNINNTAMYDNFVVEEKNSLKISKLLIENTENNTINLYEGHDIDIWNYNLELVYSDGTSDTTYLTKEMISEYDNTALGKQRITISYKGYTYPAYVFISERPEYIKEFSRDLKKFESKITDSNKEEFLAIKEVHDSLSIYEREQVSEKLLSKYEKLLEQYDRKVYKEIKGKELLCDGFLTEEKFDEWGLGLEGSVGKWFLNGQTLYEVQRTYGINGTSWRVPNVYGNISMISADLQVLGSKMYTGMALNVGQNGYYHIRISSKTVDGDGNPIYTLQLMKRTPQGGHKVLATTEPMNYDQDVSPRTWFRMTLIHDAGVVKVYINDVLMLEYDDTSSLDQFTVGECGLRISEGDCLVKNVRVYGIEQERPDEEEEYIEPTEYKDDFEDEKVGSSPSHWQEDYVPESVVDNWKVVQKGANKVYGTTKTTGNTATWLHVFDHNPTVSMKFMVANKTNASKIGFITRMAPETAFVKIGYDFSNSKWYLNSQEALSTGPVLYYAEEKSELKLNEWHTIKVEENKSAVDVYVDDVKVLSVDNVKRVAHGRIGVYTENTSMYIDDFEATLAAGDIPQDGMISYTFVPDEYAGFLEIESLDDKTLIATNSGYKMLSTDGGLTWNEISEDENWDSLYYDGMYTSLLKLKSNNKYLQVATSDQLQIQVSSDLKTWETIGQIVPTEEQTDDSGHTVAIIHVNSMTEIKKSDGTYRIFCPVAFRRYKGAQNRGHYTKVYYSDDQGVTWNESQNDTRDVMPGYDEDGSSTWAESKVIKCADGTLRMYYSRNAYGCMQYTESKDEGLTWSGLYQIPEMQCSMTSFAIAEDPYNEGTFYMVWVNGTPSYKGSMYERSRPCLVKSTDGKNWEFVMNCERMTNLYSTQNGQLIYQVIDPSLLVTKDHVFITFGRSSKEFSETSAGSHQAQRPYYIRAEKEKLETRGWDASTVSNMNFPKKVEMKKYPQTKFGLGDIFNSYNAIVKITGLNGKVRTEDFTLNSKVYSEPNMFKLGKQVVSANYSNGYKLDYEIEIVPNYNIVWSLSDGGTVEPKKNRIMEGAKEEFKLIPDEGYKVSYVAINGERTRVLNNVLQLKNIDTNLEIEIEFSPITILDYWWIGAIVLAVGGAGFIVLKTDMLKKLKSKMQKKRKVDE